MPDLQKRTNPDRPGRLKHGPEPSKERLFRWVCQVKRPNGEPIGSGILIAADLVLTCHHVVEEFIDDERIGKLEFKFDDWQKTGEGEAATVTRTVTVKAKRGATPSDTVFAASPKSLHDSDVTVPPDQDHLDYALIELATPIGEEEIGDTGKRGWVTLAKCGDVPASGQVTLLSYEEGGSLKASKGPLIAADVPWRCHYDANSADGSSGGLVYLDGEEPRPLAMHIGGARALPGGKANFGVTLADIYNHVTEGGRHGIREPRAFSRLKIAVVCGHAFETKPPVEALQAFFANEDVRNAFAFYSYEPCIGGKAACELSEDDLFNVRDDFSIDRLHEAAQAGIAFVIIGPEDGQDLVARDKLMAAYGYLKARLGDRRVHLIHKRDVISNGVYLGKTEFRHRYEQSILEIAPRAEEIALATWEPKEDPEGLFELVQIALPELGDEQVFRRADFGATKSLHIIGLRFGRLARQLPQLFDMLSNNHNQPELIIAFPGAEISHANPYLLGTLQAGGADTIQFLRDTLQHLGEQRYERGFLKRVTFFALNDIPTFILTAADLDYPQGRMLIAPAFPRSRSDTGKSKPRLVVQNKLSEIGIYDAYRRIILELVDHNANGTEYWTLDQTDRTRDYITRMEAMLRGGA